MNVTDLVLDNLDASAAITDHLDDDDRPNVAAAAADLGRATRRLPDALLADALAPSLMWMPIKPARERPAAP